MKPTDKPPIAAGISRVSLVVQTDNYSLDAQKFRFEDLARKYNCVIPEEYLIDDEGYSGTDFNRPSIRRVLQLVREGKIQAVAFPYLDRFARNVEGGLALIRKFKEAGADVLLGDLGWYTDERNYKMQMTIGLLFAEIAKDDIAMKSRAGVEQKLRDGLVHGGRAPFGYHFVTGAELQVEAMRAGMDKPRRPRNVYHRVEENIRTVILMGDLLLAGYSLRGICRELEVRGIPAPQKARWNPTTLSRILRDPCYSTGIWHWGKHYSVEPEKLRKPGIERHRTRTTQKKRPAAEWKPVPLPGGPVITADQHARIQERLDRNAATGRGRKAKEGGREAILKSLVKCARCGKAVAPIHKGRNCWYGCTARDRFLGTRICIRKLTRAADLEDEVWMGTGDALIHKLPMLVQQYRDALTGLADDKEMARMEALEPKLMSRLKEAAARELMEEIEELKRMYSDRVATLKTELQLLRRRLALARKESNAVAVDCATISRQAKTAFRTRVPAERRAILLDWVHEVRYADGEAEITLRVPLSGANCKHDEHHVDNYILLKTKVWVAA